MTSPAIVISDYHLRLHEHGSDAIERIRHRFRHDIPAILLTGDTSAVPARVVDGTGMRMLSKPVDAHRLVTVIDELLQTLLQ
jgi:CheY-like chemotaxis protein